MPPDSPVSSPAAVLPAAMTGIQRITLVATGLGLFMIFLDAMIVNVGLPAIQADFHVGEAGLQWVVTGYSLGMAVTIMSAATFADLYGRRKLYLASVAVFTAASLVCGMSGSLAMLTAARVVQGIAAAATNVTSLALVSAAFPEPKSKTRAIGIWTAIASSATALGPTLGGVLVESLSWRAIFLVNLPVGIAVLVLTWRYVVESRDGRPRQFDIPGQLLFIVTVGSFAYAVIEGPHDGWASLPILTLLSVALVGAIAFILTETRSADPMMDLALFRDRTYTLAILTIFVMFFAIYGMLLVVTQYLQNVRVHSPAVTGLLLLPFSVLCTFVSLRAGTMVNRIGSRVPILLGLGLTIGGFVMLIAGMSGSAVMISIGIGLCGAGGGFCLTPITSLAMSAVPAERAGMASGIMSAQRAIGSTVGFAVLGSILAGWLGATLDRDLATAIPDPVERSAMTRSIIAHANPHAYVAEIGPGRPITHAQPQVRQAILAAADADFIAGIRTALIVATVLLVAAFVVGYARFPRGMGGIADAKSEAAKIEADEAARGG